MIVLRNIKKHLMRFLVLAMLLLLAGQAACQSVLAQEPEQKEIACYMEGDANGDGSFTSDDAIYVLYYSLFEDIIPGTYVININCDFDNNGQVDEADALYALYSSLFSDLQPDVYRDLTHTIHSYYDPQWSWNDNNAPTLKLTCACGTSKTFTNGEGLTVTTEGPTGEELCTDAKITVYTAKFNAGEGEDYPDVADATKTVVEKATEHSLSITGEGCEAKSECKNCSYTVEAIGHSFVEDTDSEENKAATCKSAAVVAYKCTNEGCKETKTETVGKPNENAHKYTDGQDEYLDKDGNVTNEPAKYHAVRQKYTCSLCGKTTTGEKTYIHTYKQVLIQEGDCRNGAKWQQQCVFCDAVGETETQAVDTNAHKWIETSEDGATHKCSVCGETKNVTPAKENMTLTDVEEIAVGKISLCPDDTVKSSLSEEKITLTVEEKTAAELNISDDQKAQIGNATVYDFTMTNENGDKLSSWDNGTFTVTVPYTLSEGEDVEAVNIWYINDENQVENIKGTYHNGFVTFCVEHFSYYTVTRLTAAERCSLTGHVEKTETQPATCESDGFSKTYCLRCGDVIETTVLDALGHDFKETSVAATCTEAGTVTRTCQREGCGVEITGTVSALGHKWGTAVEVKATCTEAGTSTQTCERCDAKLVKTNPAKGHTPGEIQKTDATCDTKGTKIQLCEVCDEVLVNEETAPTGHNYAVKPDGWTWGKNNASATVTLYCTNSTHQNSEYTKTLNAVVTTETKAASCTADGSVLYKAVASFNQKVYETEKTEGGQPAAHKPGETMEYDAQQHYYICSVCGLKVSVAAHAWGDFTVTKPATCVASGEQEAKCTSCDAKKIETVPATGEHTYENGKCSVCGRDEGSCDHEPTVVLKSWDSAELGMCDGTIQFLSCECGKHKELRGNRGCPIHPINMTENESVFECFNCHKQVTEKTLSRTKNGCEEAVTMEITFSLNGQTILSETFDTVWESHNYEIVSSELVNKTCEEGVRYTARCTDCGYEVNDISYEHELFVEVETKQLPGTCMEKVDIVKCLCGKHQEAVTNEACQMYWDGSEYCSICGLQVYGENLNTGEKDENCFAWTTCDVVYVTSDGERVVVPTSYYGPNHDYSVKSVELLQGSKDCSDGVKVTLKCTDCGEIEQMTQNWHVTALRSDLDHVDLTGITGCGGTLGTYSCACGWTTYISSEQCRFDYDDSCVECGASIGREWVKFTEYDDCHDLVDMVFHIRWNGKTTDIPITGMQEKHNTLAKYDIAPGASCEDGFTATLTCTKCGTSSVEQYYGDGHPVYMVSEQVVAPDQVCGEIAIQKFSCACGEWQWMYNNHSACEMRMDRQSSENGGSEVGTCLNCGLQYERTWSNKVLDASKPCETEYSENVKYSLNGAVIAQDSVNYPGFDHAYVWTTKMLGETCVDGFIPTGTCANCGDVTERPAQYDHVLYEESSETILASGVACGELSLVKVGCPCGQKHFTEARWMNGRCSFDYYVSQDGVYTNVCRNCGLTEQSTQREEFTEDPCRINYSESAVYYNAAGEEVGKYAYTDVRVRHNAVYTFVLDGDSCEDGFTVNSKCLTCGEEDSFHEPQGAGHMTYAVSARQIAKGELCGDLWWYDESCACGAEKWAWIGWRNGECNLRWTGFENGEDVFVCKNCGVEQRRKTTAVPTEDPCWEKQVEEVTFVRNGEVIDSYSSSFKYPNHKSVAEYTLNGATCEDGYTCTWKCANCGEILGESEYGNSHVVRNVSFEKIEGTCGMYVVEDRCACGKFHNVRIQDESCRTEWDSEIGAMICSTCNTVRREIYGKSEWSDCADQGEMTILAERDGKEIYRKETIYQNESHRWAEELVSMDGPCENASVKYTLSCYVCGYSDGQVFSDHRSHYQPRSAQKVIEGAACEGTQVFLCKSSCSCGMYSNAWTEVYGGECGLKNSDFCAKCGVRMERGTEERPTADPCVYEREVSVRFTKNGTELDYVSNILKVFHHECDYSFNFLGGNNCDEGVTIFETCKYCSYTNTRTTRYHETLMLQNVKAAVTYPGACDGYIQIYSCPCGQNGFINREYSCDFEYSSGYDSEGNYVGWNTCKNCGLMTTSTSHTTPIEGTCKAWYTEVITVTYGGRTDTYENSHMQESHNWRYGNAVLMPGAQTCEDGVMLTMKCTKCGEERQTTNYWHSMVLQGEPIDLRTEAGAECEGTLGLYTCACGQVSEYRLETKCDLHDDYSFGTEWPGSFCNNVHPTQISSDGNRYFYNVKYDYHCSVSDPHKCGLHVTLYRYWMLDADSCIAHRYETYRLFREDGSYQDYTREIETAQYHDYDMNRYAGEAEGTVVNSEVCKRCGSTHVVTEYSETADQLRGYIEEATNNMPGSDRNQSYFHEERYGEVPSYGNAGGQSTYEYIRYVHADGTEEWNKREVTFGDCKRIATTTRSDWREPYVYEEEYHDYRNTMLRERSCSQYSIMHQECAICHKTRDTKWYSPLQHDFQPTAGQSGYVCSRCGQESTHGINGTVTLEEFADNSSYVVGIYNQNSGSVNYVVTVVLDNDTLVLPNSQVGIQAITYETNGIDGVSFSKTAVEAAAKALVQEAYPGYNGNMAIRFNVIPEGYKGDLDFAITFDPFVLAAV